MISTPLRNTLLVGGDIWGTKERSKQKHVAIGFTYMCNTDFSIILIFSLKHHKVRLNLLRSNYMSYLHGTSCCKAYNIVPGGVLQPRLVKQLIIFITTVML